MSDYADHDKYTLREDGLLICDTCTVHVEDLVERIGSHSYADFVTGYDDAGRAHAVARAAS